MNSVILNNELYASAAAGLTSLNGMYIFYGSSIGTPQSGATITALSALVTDTPGAGMARCHGLTIIPESGASIQQGGNIKFITTTANAEVIAGAGLTPGVIVNALGLAHLTPNAYNRGGTVCVSGYRQDRVLDYSVISSGGVVLPAGGYITLVDKLTVTNGADA